MMVQWKKNEEAAETSNLARLLWDTALLESGFQVLSWSMHTWLTY